VIEKEKKAVIEKMGWRSDESELLFVIF